ncbi:hypothetical protein [Streptomyces muensis]|uniref:Uncharacterized protein n=1 Tax=Streptomyces muensis TaxID=1077944 RepID=A0A9X1TQ79_STRM4|nr:hypothetical protein [Streptomyces muensis]MCF1600461.1 hypothetical protein [Streptomyces muensis]
MLHEPENTLFVRGETPVLLLAGASVHDSLPALNSSDGQIPLCTGWGVVPKLTLCVVDGPGDDGLMVPSLAAPVLDAAGPGDMGDWCGDAERAGGAVVLSVERIPEVLDWDRLMGSGTSRGGFVPIMG